MPIFHAMTLIARAVARSIRDRVTDSPWRWSVVLATAGLPGCNAILGLNPSELRDDAGPDSVPGDATTGSAPASDANADAAPSAEGPHDAALSLDAAAAADGAPDDAGAPIAAGTGWCSQNPGHTFCDDFDEYANINALLDAWSSYEQTGGSLRFDTSNALSGPNALEAVGTGVSQVLVLKTFPLPAQPSKLSLAFDLRINATGSVSSLGAVGLAGIAFGYGTSDARAALSIGNGPGLFATWQDAVDAGAGRAASSAPATGGYPNNGVWAARYVLEIDYSSSANSCVQLSKGPTTLLAQCLPIPTSMLHSAVVSIAVGVYSAGLGVTGMFDVEFDNVTFDIQ
jgi:hypothetical protein